MRNKFSLLVCLAACLSMTAGSAVGQQETNADSCLKETTLKVANRDFVITLQDAERIKLAVQDYLTKLKSKQKPSVPAPDEAYIDCSGTVRMGEWILESSVFSREPELRVTIRIHNSEILIVRREIRLQQIDGHWKVVGEARVTYHRQLK